MKKTLAFALLLSTASPALSSEFWVVGKFYEIYFNANARLGSLAFGRLIEVDEVHNYIIMDNNSSRATFSDPRDPLLDGSVPSTYHLPTTARMMWPISADMQWIVQIPKLPK